MQVIREGCIIYFGSQKDIERARRIVDRNKLPADYFSDPERRFFYMSFGNVEEAKKAITLLKEE